MSDLTAKFTAFETQIGDNHTEIMSALDTIAMALGAPPSDPTTTLADLLTAITATNTLLTGIRSDMNDQLTAIFNTVDIINTNASLNMQRLITTLLQTSCPCDDTVPLLPPDLGTTPTTAEDNDFCARIQFFVDLFASWAIQVGVYVENHGNISSFAVNNLLQLQLLDLSISTGELSGGIPTSVRDSIVSKCNSTSGVNAGIFDAMTDASNLEAIRQAIYEETNAGAGAGAVSTAINSLAGVPSGIQSLLNTMFYSSWLNDIYSDVPIVDTSGYDGTLCALAVGTLCDDNAGTVIAGSTYQARWNGTEIVRYCTDPSTGDQTSLNLSVNTIAVTVVSGSATIHCVQYGGREGFSDNAPPITVDGGAGWTHFYIWGNSSDFVVNVCVTPGLLL